MKGRKKERKKERKKGGGMCHRRIQMSICGRFMCRLLKNERGGKKKARNKEGKTKKCVI